MAFNPIDPPALPFATDEYSRPYQDQLNNIGRIFYNRLIALVNTIAISVTTLQGQVTQQVAVLPVASAGNKGIFVYLDNGAGVADEVYVCTKDAGGSFSWKLVA